MYHSMFGAGNGASAFAIDQMIMEDIEFHSQKNAWLNDETEDEFFDDDSLAEYSYRRNYDW